MGAWGQGRRGCNKGVSPRSDAGVNNETMIRVTRPADPARSFKRHRALFSLFSLLSLFYRHRVLAQALQLLADVAEARQEHQHAAVRLAHLAFSSTALQPYSITALQP
jgi:hypothetical protein